MFMASKGLYPKNPRQAAQRKSTPPSIKCVLVILNVNLVLRYSLIDAILKLQYFELWRGRAKSATRDKEAVIGNLIEAW